MKRIICLLLSLCLAASLGSCGFSSNQIRSPVSFHYLRYEESSDGSDQIISIDSELREAYGHTTDIRYLLLLYLQGPADPELTSPFPENTRISALVIQADTLSITLSGASLSAQSGPETTLACACLTKTCLDIANVTTVEISTEESIAAGEDPIVMDADSLVLWDESAAGTTSSTEETN